MELMSMEEVTRKWDRVKYNTYGSLQLKDLGLQFETKDKDYESDFRVHRDGEDFRVDLNAEAQILKTCGIPYGFYRANPVNIRKKLFDYHSKANDIWMKPVVAKERDKTFYAFLPYDYSGIENVELINLIQGLDVWKNFNIFQANINDHQFDFRAMLSTKPLDQIKTINPGDLLPGIHIQNGETGKEFSILPVVFRVYCSNGIIVPWTTTGDGLRIRKFTNYNKIVKRSPETILKSLNYALDKTEVFRQLMDRKVENAESLVTRFSEQYKISSKIRREALRYLNDPKEKAIHGTVFEIVNAFTAAARSVPDVDKRIRLEKIAWKIAERKI